MDFERLINPLIEPFSNPESRKPIGLGFSLLFVCWLPVAITNIRLYSRGKPSKPRYQNQPTSLDVQLYIGRQLLFAIIGVPTLWSAWTISTHSFLWLKEHIGIPSPPDLSVGGKNAIYALTLFVAWDLSRFLLHWLMHKVPALWAFHQVHHSATELSPLTHHRIHPVEYTVWFTRSIRHRICGRVLLLVVSRTTVGVGLVWNPSYRFCLNVAHGNIRHSSIWLPYPVWVERWFVSPAQHHIHHGIDKTHHDKNLGTWLSIWDRMAGTWVPSKHKPTAFGITDRNHKDDLLSAWFAPFAGSLNHVKRVLPIGASLALLAFSGLANAEENSDAPPLTNRRKKRTMRNHPPS